MKFSAAASLRRRAANAGIEELRGGRRKEFSARGRFAGRIARLPVCIAQTPRRFPSRPAPAGRELERGAVSSSQRASSPRPSPPLRGGEGVFSIPTRAFWFRRRATGEEFCPAPRGGRIEIIRSTITVQWLRVKLALWPANPGCLDASLWRAITWSMNSL